MILKVPDELAETFMVLLDFAVIEFERQATTDQERAVIEWVRQVAAAKRGGYTVELSRSEAERFLGLMK